MIQSVIIPSNKRPRPVNREKRFTCIRHGCPGYLEIELGANPVIRLYILN